jgi:hypothetical protein
MRFMLCSAVQTNKSYRGGLRAVQCFIQTLAEHPRSTFTYPHAWTSLASEKHGHQRVIRPRQMFLIGVRLPPPKAENNKCQQ